MSNALTGYEKNLSEFTRDELREIAKTYGISLRQIIENKINKDSLIKLIEENELYKNLENIYVFFHPVETCKER